jgi:hydroxymethylpyrimidine/phosphomethylpyrimidine kinase
MGNVVPDRFFWALPGPDEGADAEQGTDGESADEQPQGSKGISRRVH